MTAAAGSRALIVAGAASLAVRQPLTGPRRPARVIAARPAAVCLELALPASEPRVLVLTAAGTSRLPNAIAVAPGGLDRLAPAEVTGESWIGRGAVQSGQLTVRVLRWWDPSPVLGPLSRARLEQGTAALHRACASADRGPSLAGHDDPAALAGCCANGDLAGAVEAAERMVGLGPGLAPSGDNMISGLLLALRLLGGAIPGGTRAVATDHVAGGHAAALRRARSGHRGGIGGTARPGRPGAAGHRDKDAAGQRPASGRHSSLGRRSGLGAGRGLPCRAGAGGAAALSRDLDRAEPGPGPR
jgi:hypothetical protein